MALTKEEIQADLDGLKATRKNTTHTKSLEILDKAIQDQETLLKNFDANQTKWNEQKPKVAAQVQALKAIGDAIGQTITLKELLSIKVENAVTPVKAGSKSPTFNPDGDDVVEKISELKGVDGKKGHRVLTKDIATAFGVKNTQVTGWLEKNGNAKKLGIKKDAAQGISSTWTVVQK